MEEEGSKYTAAVLKTDDEDLDKNPPSFVVDGDLLPHSLEDQDDKRSPQISSPLPVEDDSLQSPKKKPSSLLKSGGMNDEEDEFDVRGDSDSSLIIVLDSSSVENSVDNQNAAKRRDKRSAAQQQLGFPNERTRLLSTSINGEDFDGYMAREFVDLGNIGPNSTEALNLPPETSSWWQKFRSWKSGRTWFPQKTPYTLESPETRWLQAFRHQGHGSSEDEEELMGDRLPSLPEDLRSGSDDVDLESSDSSRNTFAGGAPEKKLLALPLEDRNPNLLLLSESSEEDSDSLGDEGGSPQSTHSPVFHDLAQAIPLKLSKKPLFAEEDVKKFDPSSAYSPLDDEDIEAGGPSAWATFKSKLTKFFSELPPKAKAKLKRFHDQFIDKKWTVGGVVGGLIGTGIAIVYSNAMTAVYGDGLWYLEQTYEWPWLYNMFNGAPTLWALVGYIFITLLPDATPRNIESCQLALRDWGEKWQHKGRNLLLLGACFLPSLIEPFYVLQVEVNNMHVTGDSGLDNQYARFALISCPALFFDSYFSNIRLAANGLDSLKAGYANFKSFMSRHLFHQARQVLPSSEVNRQALGKSLDNVSKYFEQAPDEHITEIYANLLQIQQSDAPEEAHKVLLAISYLVSLGEEVIEGQKAKKSYYTLLADILNWGSLTAGSVARGVVLYFIFSSILGYFMPDGWAEALGVISAALAYAPRTLLEYKGMDGFFNHYLREETPTGHSSYGKVRAVAKSGALWQGLFFSLPLAVLTLQVNQTLLSGSPWFLLTSVPFVFTEVAAQTTSFHTTYTQQTTSALITLHNKGTRKCQGKDLSISYKRDLLVQLALQAQKDIKEWSSDLIDTVRMSVSLPQNLERDPI